MLYTVGLHTTITCSLPLQSTAGARSSHGDEQSRISINGAVWFSSNNLLHFDRSSRAGYISYHICTTMNKMQQPWCKHVHRTVA